MNLSARQIRAFLALYEHQHFTRAAAECNLSQPTFSILIRTLEEHVGVKLFDRSTRQVLLTREGERFLPSAQRLAKEFDACEKIMRQAADAQQERVTIAAVPSLMAGWLPQVLKAHLSHHPHVSVQVLDRHSAPCLEALTQGDADLALCALPGDTRCHSEVLFADAFSLVCPRDHPLLAQTTITPADLKAWPSIQLPRQSADHRIIQSGLFAPSDRPLIEAECITSAIGMVQAGLGICVLPTLSLMHFNNDTLVFRPLPLSQFARNIHVVTLRNHHLPAPAQELLALMREMLPTFEP